MLKGEENEMSLRKWKQEDTMKGSIYWGEMFT